MKKFFLTSIVLFLSNVVLVSCSGEVNLEDKNLVNRDRVVTFSEYLRDMEILKGNTDAIKLYDKNNNYINITNCEFGY